MNILAIDLGSHSIKAAIVKARGDRLELLSQSSLPAAGIKQGMITSMDKASASIASIIERVRESISLHIDKTVVSVNAGYLKSYTSRSKLTLESGATICMQNIQHALEIAYNQAAIGNDELALHVLPWRFYASNGTIVEDPLGMCSSTMALEAHIIAINKDDLSNIRRILALAGVSNYELVAGIYADSIYALKEDEKAHCTALVDIGHDVCQLAIYKQNSIAWIDTLFFGSDNITSDLVSMTRMQESVARRIKVSHVDFLDAENIEVETKDGGTEVMSMEIIRRVIRTRINEMLDSASGLLKKSAWKQEYTSVVFTGGTFNAQMMKDLARPKFDNLAVRVNTEPHECFLRSDCEAFKMPEYACLFGLCMYGAGFGANYELNVNGALKTNKQLEFLSAVDPSVEAEEIDEELLELNLANTYEMEEEQPEEAELRLQEDEAENDGMGSKIKDFFSKAKTKISTLF